MKDAQGERQYGLIAEEVAKVYPELVTRNAQGQVEAIRYQELAPMLLNEVQHQQRQLVAQAKQLAELKAQNARLQAMLAKQQERDAALAARLERLEAAAARAGRWLVAKATKNYSSGTGMLSTSSSTAKSPVCSHPSLFC